MLKEIKEQNQENYLDIVRTMITNNNFWLNKSILLKTNHPIAYESLDHINPFGTIQDNTRNYRFLHKCQKLYGADLSLLDLGCSGGGLVFEFALNGYKAIGLEGSDASQKIGRANWRTIPENLFTCDITKDFILEDISSNEQQIFKVISCWEVLEHIHTDDIAPLLSNVKKHLDSDGIFVGSISRDPKDPLHVTIQENSWWIEIFKDNGFDMIVGYSDALEFDEFCRGIAGGQFDSHNYMQDPHKGLHFVARKQK